MTTLVFVLKATINDAGLIVVLIVIAIQNLDHRVFGNTRQALLIRHEMW